MKKILLPLLLLASGTQAQGLDVNDVSFLLPLKRNSPHPAYELQRLPGLSEDNFGRVLRFENPGLDLSALPYTDAHYMQSRANWRLTSWRFDPCGEAFHFNSRSPGDTLVAEEGPGCKPRLRLVFQPLSVTGQPLATALHFLFQLSPETTQRLGQRLVELRDLASEAGAPTIRVPLSLHPALVQELSSGSRTFSDRMLAALDEAASTSSLEFITLAVRATVNHWRFVGGTIIEGKWQRFVSRLSLDYYDWNSSNLLPGVEDISCNQLSVCTVLPLPKPHPADDAPLVLNEIFSGDGPGQQLPSARTVLTKRKAERIDDASQTNFFKTNCISCHQSSNLRERSTLLEENATPLDGPTPFVPRRYVTDSTNGVINFGYFGTIPRISTRTAAESVRAAERTNDLLGLNFQAPGLAPLPELWACLMSQTESQHCFDH